MVHTSSITTIYSSADAIWQVIRDFGAAGQYLNDILICKVEGEGVGAVRTLTSADGNIIVERLEVLDDSAHRLSYLLLTDTPFLNCLTTITIHELSPGQIELEWSATFQSDGIPTIEAEQMLTGALVLNGLALKQFMEK
jgi:hypothetical protein